MTPPNPRPPDEELENNRNNRKAKSKGREDTRTDGNEKSIMGGGTPDIREIPKAAKETKPIQDDIKAKSPLRAGLTKGHGHWTVFFLLHLFFFIESFMAITLTLPKSHPLQRFAVEYLSPFDQPFRQANSAYIPESECIVDVLRVSPQLVLGTTMAVIGGLMRWACYRAMKELFTFQLSVRKGHRLVTWGPYAYVRHPSYTGALLAGSGTIVSLVVGRGSWVRECLWTFLSRFIWRFHWRAPGNTTNPSLSWEIESFDLGPTLVVLALTLLLARVAFVPRMKKEDAMMEREFGQEWRQWRTRVRWKMVPWIY